ncbi:DNA primase [Candidatus Microgenomates bacterium]|nr:DNA primase [Candidatus Microgenomates bacterium]
MISAAEEVKKKLDIVEFVGSYITLKKAGRNFRANCPFHQEKSPSFIVSPDRQIWHCFGSCHEGGDAIKFFMKWENIPFNEALKELAQKVGVKIETSSIEDAALKTRSRLLKANQLAAQYYRYVLVSTPVGQKAREYLAGRGVNEKIAEKFGIGYAPQSWDSLSTFLASKGFSPKELEDAGLVIPGGRGVHDRFRGRLIFPIQDTRGNIIAFSGRILQPDEKSAKYINSPESVLYHKRETLYGIFHTKDAIKNNEAVILVEGEFDVIMPYQFGIENIVAVKGSAVTREQLQLIKRYGSRLIFALDADSSGEDAIKRGFREAEDMDFEVSVMVLDFAHDPDEAVRTNLLAFKKALKNAIPIYDFLFDSLKRKYSIDDPFGKKKIVDEIVAHLQRIPNPIIQSHYVRKISSQLEVSEESLLRSIQNQRRRGTMPRRYAPKTEPKQKDEDRHTMIQKYVLSLLFQSKPDIDMPLKDVYESVSEADFSLPAYCQLFELSRRFFNEHKTLDERFPQTIPAELVPVYDELLLYGTFEESQLPHNIVRLAHEVKENAIKRTIKTLTSGEKDMSDTEEEQIRQLQKELKEVEKKLGNG